jgi:hypothetical protein
MKYENISKLVDSLERRILDMAYYWHGRNLFSKQEGIIRTNCMDCLDRTNVVQCAIARRLINIQLLRVGIQSYPEKGIGYYGIIYILSSQF